MHDYRIPDDLAEFFHWVKRITEANWAEKPDPIALRGWSESHDESFWGAKWAPGLTPDEIDALEIKWGIHFPPDMRLFLEILHCVDRPDFEDVQKDWESTEKVREARHLFYNWRTQDAEIEARLKWPFETIFQDIRGLNRFWMRFWGQRPESNGEKAEILRTWLAQAPTLIPIFGHRFVVGSPIMADNPVLSVMGTDIIVYGWDLRFYLLHELQHEFAPQSFDTRYIAPEDTPFQPELERIAQLEDHARKTRHIPLWEDLIMSYSTGWGSFGREFPHSIYAQRRPFSPPGMYHNKVFRPVRNAPNGETTAETLFIYFHEGQFLSCHYAGGRIVEGHLIGLVDAAGNIDMRYHQINDAGELMTGICTSRPEIMENGKIRLHETWRWTSGDGSAGESVLEEV